MFWPLLIIVLLGIIGFIAAAPMLARGMKQRQELRAISTFKVQREQMEAKFLELASAQGKPRGVRWKQCDWNDDVTFAREKSTGLITAFASVNVSFEAIEGGDMEEVEHVGLLRDGCALFHYQVERWGTGGRVLFNMNPQDALARFSDQYEPVSPA